MTYMIWAILRVVHTQVISFLKSMSQRVGSDVERLRIWNNIFLIILKIHFIQIWSRSMSESPLSDIDFKNEVTWVSTTLKYLAKGIPNQIKYFAIFSTIMEIFQNFGNSDKQIMSTFDGQ